MTTETLTAETITDDQIRALRTEAAAAGDTAMVQICDGAILPRLLPHDAPAAHRAMNVKLREQARAMRGECADAINAGQG